jgi:hypothetical protein
VHRRRERDRDLQGAAAVEYAESGSLEGIVRSFSADLSWPI